MQITGYELLPNKQILVVKEHFSEAQPNGKATVKEPYTMLEKIVLTPDKTIASVGELVNIGLKWQLFDLQTGQHYDDPANISPFKVNVAGTQAEINTVNGTTVIQFSSQELGEYIIKTENLDVDNAEIKVVVTNA